MTVFNTTFEGLKYYYKEIIIERNLVTVFLAAESIFI